ncbi:putative ATP-dependent RNA helicase ddx27 [Perkinsus olseni]|uniref:Putative ATP-dependent RNA helicase ddx27 n=1 Tax=Perkinsus olseni TaxID=32597 RepID=A0A7J6PAX1_PEROL|nr:putative ATP-dependent RNA helicase ddx27 [Perkinsus olseni]
MDEFREYSDSEIEDDDVVESKEEPLNAESDNDDDDGDIEMNTDDLETIELKRAVEEESGDDEDDEDEAAPAAQEKTVWDELEEANPMPASQEEIVTSLQEKIDRVTEESTEESSPEEETPAGDEDKSDEADSQEKEKSKHLQTHVAWASLQLSRPVLRGLNALGFAEPTPVQRDVIPVALRSQDILATAETGSGKTGGFLLPIIERLCQASHVRSRRKDPHTGRITGGRAATKALVLLPTRELAVQCYKMLRDFTKFAPLTSCLVVGGFDSQKQAAEMRAQPDVVLATPGRVLDLLLNSPNVHLEMCEIVVLDECDRLLEMGFRDECLTIIQKHCNRSRQTMMFSATMNQEVLKLAKVVLSKPVTIETTKANRVSPTLTQEFIRVTSEQQREATLLAACTKHFTKRCLIFCAQKKTAHRMAVLLGLVGKVKFAELHGNLSQQQRVKALADFESGKATHLICTDLAARGLDLPHVETVINFELPPDVTKYVHRVGRTARAGASGTSVTMYTPGEYKEVKHIAKKCTADVKKKKSSDPNHAKVLERTVDSEDVKAMAVKITESEDKVKQIMQEESVERELRLADVMAKKVDNMKTHRKEIDRRPRQQWIRKGAGAEAIEAASKVPKTRSEKRAAKKLEAQQAKKDQERAERRHEEGMQRSLAKRMRKKDRGGRMRAGFEGDEDRTDMVPSRKKKSNKKGSRSGPAPAAQPKAGGVDKSIKKQKGSKGGCHLRYLILMKGSVDVCWRRQGKTGDSVTLERAQGTLARLEHQASSAPREERPRRMAVVAELKTVMQQLEGEGRRKGGEGMGCSEITSELSKQRDTMARTRANADRLADGLVEARGSVSTAQPRLMLA